MKMEIEDDQWAGWEFNGDGRVLGSTNEAAQNNASQISTAPDKDALGDGSLDAVSGGSWPYATMGSAHVGPTI